MNKTTIGLVCLCILLCGCGYKPFPSGLIKSIQYQQGQGVIVGNGLGVCRGEFCGYNGDNICINNAVCKYAPYNCPNYYHRFEVDINIATITGGNVSDLYFDKEDC